MSLTRSVGGGFASQFQVAGAHWLTVAAGLNYSLPVVIRGHIRGYTAGKECSHVKNDYTCLFLPMSSCQTELFSTGILIKAHKRTKDDVDESMVPPQFAHMGLAWWWGIVQARMFRMQPVVEDYIKSEIIYMKNMNGGRGFTFGSPIAGLHVRHGDKSVDGFADHSFDAELLAIRVSSECRLGPKDYCSTSNTNILDNDGVSTRIAIFVASDDDNVLITARKRGHLVDSSGSGLSQKTSKTGMANTLNANPEMGYNASLEIVRSTYRSYMSYTRSSVTAFLSARVNLWLIIFIVCA